MTSSLTFENGTHISWNRYDDGGGHAHYPDFLNAIGDKKRYNKCLEWCAGSSVISFSLLDKNIIDKSVLMDIYEPALLTAVDNAHNNNLQDRVSHYVCDEINKIPKHERFDLVIANPPHALEQDSHLIRTSELTEEEFKHCYRITIDADWQIHKEFYENITTYLEPNADIFISEIWEYPKLSEMALKAGLKLIRIIDAPNLSKDSGTSAYIRHYQYEKEIY